VIANVGRRAGGASRATGAPAPRWRVALPCGFLVLAAAIGVPVTRAAGRATDVRTQLLAAARLVAELREQLRVADIPAARRTVVAIQKRTAAARAGTDDATLRLARSVPAVGADVTAVRAVATTLDTLARTGLPALVDAAGLGGRVLALSNGRLDLAALRAAAPATTRADDALRQARDRIAGIPTGALTAAVRAAVDDLRRGLDDATRASATAVRVTTLLPAMLGADRPRTYLVLFQNPAELRATGGIAGAFDVLSVDAGVARILDHGSTMDLGSYASPVLPLDPAVLAMYGPSPGMLPPDLNVSPDFPTAARLAREMYRRRTGRAVDGVLATDPVAMSYLLGATGPLAVAGGPPLTADNAVRVLLSDTYLSGISPAEQDRYFADAARTAFDALTHRPLDPGRLLASLARAVGERRVLLWSAEPAEEAAISGTALDGVLPVQDGARPTVGVFLNDGSGAKLGYYLRQSAGLSTGCGPAGRLSLTVRVRLSSVAPSAGLPLAVTGLARSGDPYTARTLVAFYSPSGGAVGELRVDDRRVPFAAMVDGDRHVALIAVDIPPGGSRAIDLTMLSAPPRAGRAWATPALRTTPAVTPWQVVAAAARRCGQAH
jgi:hypothetical protein